jgi:hypothetical protein
VPAGPVGVGAEDAGRNGASADHNVERIEETREDEKSEAGIVTDFIETDKLTSSSRLPSLEEVLAGDRGLLLKAQTPRVTVEDCESMHRVLVRQGCVSTDHLVELMRFSRQGSVSSGGSVGENRNGNAGGSDALVLMQGMGIGAFHAMALIKYIDSLVEQRKV